MRNIGRIVLRMPCLAAALLAAQIAAAPIAAAGDSDLIWNFSQNSETSYTARLGMQLPVAWQASMGADFAIAGPDPTAHPRPMAMWSTVTLPESRHPAGSTQRKVDLRLRGLDGPRTVSLSSARTLESLNGLTLRYEQLYVLDHDPAGEAGPRARTAQNLRLTSADTGTTLFARGAHALHEERWRTSFGLEQKVAKAITLHASVDDPGEETRVGRVRANYSHRW